jgi:hypothetical protein
MDTTPDATLASAIDDVRAQPIGAASQNTYAIIRRVLQRTGATVPVAAFQSSI